MENPQNKSHEPFKISGNWEAQSQQLKSKFKQLTDEDLKFEFGKEQELLSRVENKLHKRRDEVINILNSNKLELVNSK